MLSKLFLILQTETFTVPWDIPSDSLHKNITDLMLGTFFTLVTIKSYWLHGKSQLLYMQSSLHLLLRNLMDDDIRGQSWNWYADPKLH